jgi:hypothetical protein
VLPDLGGERFRHRDFRTATWASDLVCHDVSSGLLSNRVVHDGVLENRVAVGLSPLSGRTQAASDRPSAFFSFFSAALGKNQVF